MYEEFVQKVDDTYPSGIKPVPLKSIMDTIFREQYGQGVINQVLPSGIVSPRCSRCGSPYSWLEAYKKYCPSCQQIDKAVQRVDAENDEELSKFAREALDHDPDREST